MIIDSKMLIAKLFYKFSGNAKAAVYYMALLAVVPLAVNRVEAISGTYVTGGLCALDTNYYSQALISGVHSGYACNCPANSQLIITAWTLSSYLWHFALYYENYYCTCPAGTVWDDVLSLCAVPQTIECIQCPVLDLSPPPECATCPPPVIPGIPATKNKLSK